MLIYDGLYYVSEANTGDITDEKICGADSLLVYAADHDNRDVILEKIRQCNPQLTECEMVSQKDMWTLYRLH